MEDTGTPTLSPPSEPIPTEPPPEATATTEPAAEQPEGQPAEGAETVTEPTVTWDSVRESLQGLEELDHDELFALEGVKPHLDKRVQDAHDEAYRELQGHMQPLLQGNKESLSRIEQSMEEVSTTLTRAASDNLLDQRAVEDLLRRNRDVFTALNKTYQTTGFWEGVRQYVNLVGQDSGDSSIAMTFLPRVERMENNVPDPTFMKDLVKTLTSKARQEGKDEGFKAGKKAQGEATSQVKKAQTRSDEGPNLADSTPTGGTKKYKDLTPGERSKMSSKEIDAMLARERGEG